MESKNILQMVIAVAIGVIMLGPLASVITDAQTDAGDPTTKINESYEYVSLASGDVQVQYSNGTLTINDEVQNVPATAGQIIFACDYLIVWFNGTNPYGSYVNQASGIRNVTSYDITVSDSKLTASVTYDNNVTQTATDQEITFSFYYDPDGKYSVFDMRHTQPYVSNEKDVIAVGTYYTGENKTFYWYYNGIASGINADYTYGIDIETTKTAGTTDIYNVTAVTFDISGETFTPFYMIVPKEISGHATSGSMYDMLGVIPLLVTIGLILGVVGVIASRRLE